MIVFVELSVLQLAMVVVDGLMSNAAEVAHAQYSAQNTFPIHQSRRLHCTRRCGHHRNESAPTRWSTRYQQCCRSHGHGIRRLSLRKTFVDRERRDQSRRARLRR